MGVKKIVSSNRVKMLASKYIFLSIFIFVSILVIEGLQSEIKSKGEQCECDHDDDQDQPYKYDHEDDHDHDHVCGVDGTTYGDACSAICRNVTIDCRKDCPC